MSLSNFIFNVDIEDFKNIKANLILYGIMLNKIKKDLSEIIERFKVKIIA